MLALVFPARKADVANDANETASRYKRVEASLPNSIQLVQELVIVSDVTQLPFTTLYSFSVQYGGDVTTRCTLSGARKSIVRESAMVQVVPRGQLLQLCLYGGNQLFVFGDPRQICLVIQDFAEASGKVLRSIEEISDYFSGFGHGFIISHSVTNEFALGVKIKSARLDFIDLVSVCRSEIRDQDTAAFGQLLPSHDEYRRPSRATDTLAFSRY